jgi:hypothetical protein
MDVASCSRSLRSLAPSLAIVASTPSPTVAPLRTLPSRPQESLVFRALRSTIIRV